MDFVRKGDFKPQDPADQKPINKKSQRHRDNHSEADSDTIASISARLKNVQITCRHQREEIREKAQIIQNLKAENTFLKNFRDDANREYERMKRLQFQNEDLRSKVEQMSIYLKKYGLKWGHIDHEELRKDTNRGYQYRLPNQININIIVRRVKQLNQGLYAEGMGTEVYHENGIHKFRQAEPLPIGFFSNGLAIKGYQFFPYSSKESLQILGDLVDGYFPFVLKGQYPDGVFLKVVDRIDEKYSVDLPEETIKTFGSVQSREFRPQSKEEFINKLPKQIVKDGKVINIRSQMEKKLNGNTGREIPQEQNDIFVREDGMIVFKTPENRQLRENKVNQEEICTLKIRNEQGEVFILHLFKEKLVKEIYIWIGKVSKNPFVLLSNYPKREYRQDQSQNLETLGFFPNAMLHIHTFK